MNIQDCCKGLRVTYKNTGKSATVQYIDRNKGEIEIAFDNGMTARAHPSLLEPIMANQSDEPAPTGPVRPCPRCAKPMHYQVSVCPHCGFLYGVTKSDGKAMARLVAFAVVVIIIGLIVWKLYGNR